MERGDFLLLLFSTTVVLAFLRFSYVSYLSVLSNFILFIWILFHFTLVVGITTFLLKDKKRKTGWTAFIVLFIVTGFIGLQVFPTEEITRLFFIEPSLLVISLVSVLVISHISKNYWIDNPFIFYPAIVMMILFIAYTLFYPLITPYFIDETFIPTEIQQSNYSHIKKYYKAYVPIVTTTITNPTPISLPIPIEKIDFCLYSNKGNPLYYSLIVGHVVEEILFNIGDTETNQKDLKEEDFFQELPNLIKGDLGYRFINKKYIIYKVPPFETIVVTQVAPFNGYKRSERDGIGYFIYETGSIDIVQKGENQLPGGHYPCEEAKTITKINFI